MFVDVLVESMKAGLEHGLLTSAALWNIAFSIEDFVFLCAPRKVVVFKVRFPALQTELQHNAADRWALRTEGTVFRLRL
jgi:hypothetical protein